ncbi:uncharacterized protein ACNLHF_014037 [Anomaloglossus baeobatrachus]
MLATSQQRIDMLAARKAAPQSCAARPPTTTVKNCEEGKTTFCCREHVPRHSERLHTRHKTTFWRKTRRGKRKAKLVLSDTDQISGSLSHVKRLPHPTMTHCFTLEVTHPTLSLASTVLDRVRSLSISFDDQFLSPIHTDVI